MTGVCSDNRFEIIAKVKEHLIKATNIEMQPEELKQADNILFRLWQLGYFKQVEFERENAELKEQIDALANVNIKAQKIISKAKEIIKRLIKATYGEGWNYSLQVKVEAEQFLKESE